MSSNEQIVLVGGGGHCKACIDVIEAEGTYSIKGVIDIPEKKGQGVLNYPIFGSDEDLGEIVKGYKYYLITIGFITSPQLRIERYKLLKEFGGIFPAIISPDSYVSKYSHIGEGTIIMHGSVLNASSNIGENCIINNLALVEHDVEIGNHSHISTGARINGGCRIGENCFIGSGAVLNQGTAICSNVVIGSGSLVRKSITSPGVYAGNPLRKIG